MTDGILVQRHIQDGERNVQTGRDQHEQSWNHKFGLVRRLSVGWLINVVGNYGKRGGCPLLILKGHYLSKVVSIGNKYFVLDCSRFL
jgi:hypothetical protein